MRHPTGLLWCLATGNQVPEGEQYTVNDVLSVGKDLFPEETFGFTGAHGAIPERAKPILAERYPEMVGVSFREALERFGPEIDLLESLVA